MSRFDLIFKYLKGRGLEIGACDKPAPTPQGLLVTYVDHVPLDELKRQYHMVEFKQDLHYVIDNAEKLTTFPENSQDFIISSHVLEHCQDTIGTIKNWLRVVRSGGYLWIALPEKTETFDKDRQVTSFEHLELDHLMGPERSAEEHYREYFSLVDGNKGEELETRIKHAVENNVNIHFHVFSEASTKELFEKLKPLGYEIVEMVFIRYETIWLLRKK